MDCDNCIHYEGKENSHCYMFESCSEIVCECPYYLEESLDENN